MSNFANWKCRASAFDAFKGTSTKASEILTDTAKSYLNEKFEDGLFGETPDLYTIEIQKGKECENEAISLIRKVTQKFYTKFDDKVEISNEFVKGHPDIADAITGELIEIKCPFRVKTWFRYTETKAFKAYEWQVKAYLWMLGLTTGKLAICAIPTPPALIVEDMKACGAYNKNLTLPDAEYREWEDKFKNYHNFEVIPEMDRVKFYDVTLTQDDIDKMTSRIMLSREYLQKLESSDSLAHAITRPKEVSFLTTGLSSVSDLSDTDRIISKYKEFGIELKFDEKIQGASVSQYRFTPLRQGIKIEKAKAYNSDIMAVLKSDSVIIETPIPKTGQIGIQIPNEVRTILSLPTAKPTKDLILSVGQNIGGQDYELDLATAPHLLIAGATGSGKSVLLKTIISQLKNKKVGFEILDPKSEFTNSIKEHEGIYKKLKEIKQTIIKNTKITDKSTINPFIIILDEMETLLADTQKVEYKIDLEKYPIFITKYRTSANGSVSSKEIKNPAYLQERTTQRFQPKIGEACGALIEYIVRLGRSEKIHLIGATQNPTVKNISSTIKANCPTRICLRVSSQVNSQVILDEPGGEKLLGNGDMLLMSPKETGLIRLQSYFIA